MSKEQISKKRKQRLPEDCTITEEEDETSDDFDNTGKSSNELNYESEGELEVKKLKRHRKISVLRFQSRNKATTSAAAVMVKVNRQKSEFEFGDYDDETNKFVQLVEIIQTKLMYFYHSNKSKITKSILSVLFTLYIIYVGFSFRFQFGDEPSITLLGLTVLIVLIMAYKIIFKPFHSKLTGEISNRICCVKLGEKFSRLKIRITWIILIVIYSFWVIYVLIDIVVVSKQYKNLISGLGMIFFIVISFLFSHNPAKVKWRPVLWGLALQGAFAIIILRTEFGYNTFDWIGGKITSFIQTADAGSKMVFGKEYIKHFIAFKIMPVIVFFSTCISILYYWGIIQSIIRLVSSVMQMTMGTTAGESLSAAANIFLGNTEVPLIIKPLLPMMTRSELHSVMTGGFATISGSIMAAYISLGVPANHILTASVMSAPAALGISKLLYPETLKSKTSAEKTKDILTKGDAKNFLEAAAKGAFDSNILVLTIVANLIAFTALLELFNTILTWFGERIGHVGPEYESLTFQYLCSYIFYPLVLLMGVPLVDARRVASMLGIKIFLNEFIAFKSLQVYINNTNYFSNWTQFYPNDTIRFNRTSMILSRHDHINGNLTDVFLKGGILDEKSIVISTYALCGFSNIAAIGSTLGVLPILAPTRTKAITQVAIRAMIGGNIACFLTACVAGLLFRSEHHFE